MMDARLFHTRHLGSYPARCELDDGIAESRIVNSRLGIASIPRRSFPNMK
jgi:hypothetical protein